MLRPLVNVSHILEGLNKQDEQPYELAALQSEHLAGRTIEDISERVKGGSTVHFMTDGAWSLYQLVMEMVLGYTGPAKMYVSTYAMSEAGARCLSNLKAHNQLKAIHCLIDNRVDTRTAGSLQLLKQISDEVSMAACHAKATVLIGESAHILVLGSANWTENKRIETGIITADKDAVKFHKQWITDAIRDNR